MPAQGGTAVPELLSSQCTDCTDPTAATLLLLLLRPAGDNSIAITNLCRDEVTVPLKDKIEAVFGSSFNSNGLGAVLTCGVTGMGAGFSHSPIAVSG
jgi:hypothetical protein